MKRIGIFDPNQDKYILENQCETCEYITKNVNDIWRCRTCKKDICESCKKIDHINCDLTKDSNDIVLSHTNDCDCELCNNPYLGLLGSQIVFDKNHILIYIS